MGSIPQAVEGAEPRAWIETYPYQCPAGRRAIVRDVHLTPNGTAIPTETFTLGVYQDSGLIGVLAQGGLEGIVTHHLVMDAVLEPEEWLYLLYKSNTIGLNWVISGAELVL